MILLDSDVLLLDLRYRNDPKSAVNRQALQQLRAANLALGITSQALLEVVEILSFNIPAGDIPLLPGLLCSQYRLSVRPDFHLHPEYAGCKVPELVTQMGRQMALGDAVLAVQVARHAPSATCLLTWNARHFARKMTIPALTPEDWLNQQSGTTP